MQRPWKQIYKSSIKEDIKILLLANINKWQSLLQAAYYVSSERQ